MFVGLFGKKIHLTLKLTFDLELWQNKRRNQKRPLLKIFNLVQVSFVPSGIILLQNAVGMLLTCPLIVSQTLGQRLIFAANRPTHLIVDDG